MKKLQLLLLAMCAFMCACTNEQEPVAPETVEVSFNLDVENQPITRAISDGTGATQLMYGVFNEAGELVISKNVVENVTALLTPEGYKMSVSLTKGQSYKAVFWAQNPDCEAYTVSDDMQLTVNYEGINNDEARDAFYAATEIFKVEDSRTVGVVLKRP
ncbi:MAG: FimB/Mfa2 family fimbrial subunit, partial [Bacteroidaceae bacterium]|nr:FimB/Mfa2 family fimbrial subunit [Bacteroidaceae bacterium]